MSKDDSKTVMKRRERREATDKALGVLNAALDELAWANYQEHQRAAHAALRAVEDAMREERSCVIALPDYTGQEDKFKPAEWTDDEACEWLRLLGEAADEAFLAGVVVRVVEEKLQELRLAQLIMAGMTCPACEEARISTRSENIRCHQESYAGMHKLAAREGEPPCTGKAVSALYRAQARWLKQEQERALKVKS